MNCINSLTPSTDLKKVMLVVSMSLKPSPFDLTLSWRRSLSCRKQSIDLQSKAVDWFLYDWDLDHERVNREWIISLSLLDMKVIARVINQKCDLCFLHFFFIWTIHNTIDISSFRDDLEQLMNHQSHPFRSLQFASSSRSFQLTSKYDTYDKHIK